jgi:TonB family protein
MRGSLLTSGFVHLAIVLALLVVRHSTPLSISGADVVQVQLLDASAMKAITAPAPQPPPAIKSPEVKPVEEEGVKLTPEKDRKKPPKPEPPRETPPASTPPPALPYAQMGSPGLSGQIAVDTGDFAFAYYLRQVRSRIAQNWTPPAGLQSGQPIRAIVYFKISRDGSVSSVRMETGSALEFFDRSAVRAVTLSDPMPPLPLGFEGSDLGVHFGFQYQQP